MILTCPACDTKYVVKENAIPPGGRQVRCASCKHSWHQEPEGAVVEAESAAVDFGAGSQTDATEQQPVAEASPEAVQEGFIAGEPQPADSDPQMPNWYVPASGAGETAEGDGVSMEEAPAIVDEWRPPETAEIEQAPVEESNFAVEEPVTAFDQSVAVAEEPVIEPETAPVDADEEFVGYAPIADEDDASPRRWPLILGILALIIAAAAAFWFLAPAEWKQRAGIAQAGATPLQLMITTNDRQPLESGNELIAISGRVINPTDQDQPVPPIQAELRDKQSQKVVHRWTIAPPARVLAPRSSASFNSAEIDVPKGGDELTITLGRVGS